MDFFKRLRMFLRKPEGFFLGVSATFGVILILIIPPLQTPDEASHFLRAYQVSQLKLIPSEHHGTIGGELPKSLKLTMRLLESNPPLKFHSETKYDIHKTAAALHIHLNKSDTTFITGITSYSPVGYIPQAIGIALGTLLNLPPVVLIYIARLASLLAWIALVFFAIKLVPSKKWAFAGIGLLPMLVAQGISPGIDAISIGLGVLFIAVVLKMRTIDRVEERWWLILMSMACLIALTKQTTILVLGFVFLLEPSRFDIQKWKSITKKILIVVLPILIFIGWMLLLNRLNLTGSSGVEGQDSAGQISNLLHHPLRFFRVLFNTFFTTWGDDIVRSLIGNFGWADTPLAAGIINLGYVFIAGLLFINYEPLKQSFTRNSKVLISILIALYTLGTCGALYVFYSPVDFAIVYGLQGRYFLLILFMAIPLLVGTQFKAPKYIYIKFACLGSVALLLASILTIYLRYYVTLF